VTKHNYSFENKDVQVSEVHTRMDSFSGAMVNNSGVRKNFFMMTFFWLSCSNIFYIIALYPITFKTSVENVIISYYMLSSIVDIVGASFGGFFVYCAGTRKAFVISFVMAAFGSMMLILVS
jgi:Na+/melibiose symporter-like transporter